MRERSYWSFSRSAHIGNLAVDRPSVCQFELTFGCDLRCRHCYTDCYNKPSLLSREMGTRQIKSVLKRVRRAGVLWLCLTGGDPMTRPDFFEIYDAAKRMGFIVTVFTNGMRLDAATVRRFKERPPFVLEMTLNAATRTTHDRISQVTGSFGRALSGIRRALKARLPVRIKTQVTQDNVAEQSSIRGLIEGMGLPFLPSYELHPRLDRDPAPCRLRVEPDERPPRKGRSISLSCSDDRLFSCAIHSGDGFYIDPVGRASLCHLMRAPWRSLLKTGVGRALREMQGIVGRARFSRGSKCLSCGHRSVCSLCPGKAYLETGRPDGSVSHYCEQARR